MKITGYKKNLRITLLLSAFLLAMQAMLVWHQHHDKVLADEHCQICLLAQHYTPGPVSQPAPILLLFTHFVIHVPAYHDVTTPTYYLFKNPRAPPAFLA
ncbi:MAG: hypothetical protein PVG20_00295 [Thioalkalispiraceae bacterium]